MKFRKKFTATLLSAALILTPFTVQNRFNTQDSTAAAAETSSDIPQEYQSACDWIWANRIETEGSAKSWSTVYDQIIAGNGTLQYILIWQSYEPITLEQRQKLPQMLEEAVNQWTDNLVGYDDWPYEHVNVEIIGYAVLDKNCLLDLQPNEVVYTDTTDSWLRDDMISSGMGNESVPAIQPAEPTDISRYAHWADKNWNYNGSYDNRYDMYLHGITGMINMGGYGYHYGQILSDQSILGLIDGTTSQHILLHEMGHSFGFPDYYGGEGESDGFPPGGFPGGEGSIMMAGSCMYINNFDKWFTRYAWSRMKEEQGRFDLSSVTTQTTATTTTTVNTTTTTATTEPIAASSEIAEFCDTITNITLNENGYSSISFERHGSYIFTGQNYYDDESKNLSFYEAGDSISLKFTYNTENMEIINIESLKLVDNVRTIKGDVNDDKQFSIADITLLQKWLLAEPDTTLVNWKAGDIYEDDKLDVFDLCLMRKMLLDNQ